MQADILFPDIGAASALLSHWFADEGERVFAGDCLVEILVDGATFDVAAPATGLLAAKRALPYDRVSPGEVLGVVEVEAESDQAPDP